jgi:uncharacterized protein
MNKEEIILKTVGYVKEKLSGESSGHDWYHVYRVWKNGKHIAEIEGGDSFVVELAALLHDIADWKFNDGDETIGGKVSREWLEFLKLEKETIDHVCEIIDTSSFKGAGVENKIKTLEGKILQDADRLDAIGAIGIARAFAYGGSKNKEMYNPDVKPEFHTTSEQYKNNKSSTINHFYEKLLLLKDLMNTNTAQKMAEERHQFMELFLSEFMKEWKSN